MIDKIKTIKEIIEPKANELGLSFEEVLEHVDNDRRLSYFLEQLDKKYRFANLYGICTTPLFEYSKMVNYLSDHFNLNITRDEYVQVLKKKVLDVLKTPGYQTSDSILLINHSSRDIMCKSRLDRKKNIDAYRMGVSGWNAKKVYDSHDLYELNVNKIINDLNIDIKSPKYKVLVIDGDKEFQRYLSLLNMNDTQGMGNNSQSYAIQRWCYLNREESMSLSLKLLPFSIDEINEKLNFIEENHIKISELNQILQKHRRCFYHDERIIERNRTWNSKIYKHPNKKVKENWKKRTCYLQILIETEEMYKLINSTKFKEIKDFLHFPAKSIIEHLLSRFNKNGFPKPYYYSNEDEFNSLLLLRAKMLKMLKILK